MFKLMDCDSVERLDSAALDDIPNSQRESYEHHLESCTACQERLDNDSVEEPMRQMARRIGDPTAQPADPTLQEFLSRLRDYQHLGHEPATSVDLYFLQPSDDENLLGTLGPYEIQEIIGQGGMGIVLKAYEPSLQRLVAVKVLAPALAGSATARRRFVREARASASVRHENIVTVHAVDEIQGLPYFVMEYVGGESLQDRLDDVGALPLDDIVAIGRQTAFGLAAAHARGLIHRDIKPANILLEKGSCRVKITDFGLARLVDDVHLTQNGAVVGTPEYMAPEQARGEHVDHRADLFSLGGVLYAMSSGRPPYSGPSTMAVLRSICDDPPPSPSQVNSDTPVWLERFIATLLTREKSERLQSAERAAELLERYQAHLSQIDVVPEPVLPQSTPCDVPKRRRFSRAIIGLSLLLALGAGYWLFTLLFAQVTSPASVDFYHDFRGQPLPRQLDFHGGADGKYFRDEAEGFRITLPKDWKHPWGGSGLMTTFGLEGDFEITTTVEILNAQTPNAGYGSGIRLYFNKVDSREGVTLCRMVRPGNNEILLCDQTSAVSSDGKTEYRIKEFMAPCSESKLQLRMKRRGTTVYFLWAPMGDKNFTEIHRTEFGAEPVKRVVLTAINGRQPVDLDVRLIDLRIRGGQTTDSTAASDTPSGTGSSGAVGWLAGGAVSIGLLFLATWFLVRRRKSSADDDDDGDDDAEATQPKPVMKRTPIPSTRKSKRRLRQILLPLLPLLLAFLILGWRIPTWLSESNASEKSLAEGSNLRANRNEVYLSFKGNEKSIEKLKRTPGGNQNFVKTEPEGIRITLPTGLEGFGEGVQLNMDMPIKGNFEITLGFEILTEPDAKLAREASGVGLVVEMEGNANPKAAVYRGIYRAMGSTFSAWISEQKNEGVRLRRALGYVPTQARKGNLKLVRIGTAVYYYVAGEDGLFNLINRHPLGSAKVKSIGIFASTGGPKAFLDARVTDLRIKAHSLPDTISNESSTPSTNEANSPSIIVVGLIVLLGAAGITLCTRQWLAKRHVDVVSLMFGFSLCLLVFVVGIWVANQFDEEASAAESGAKTLQGLTLSLKGEDNSQGMDLIGPGASKCVRFDTDGLRIALPTGWPGTRPVTGIASAMVLKGDFEITMRFAILKEPTEVKKGTGTRLSLVVFLNTPKPTVATLNRSVGELRKQVFVAWMSRWDDTLKKPRSKSRNVSTDTVTGELRLVRNGSVLSYYVSEKPGNDFILLRQYAFGDDDVKEIRIAGSTGDRDAMLEALVTDLRIRAQGLAGVSTSGRLASTSSSSLLVLCMIFLALTVAGMGTWWMMREDSIPQTVESPTGAEEPDRDAASAIVSYACSGCGKRLRSKARLIGKKIKCPQCGNVVLVEDTAIKELEQRDS